MQGSSSDSAMKSRRSGALMPFGRWVSGFLAHPPAKVPTSGPTRRQVSDRPAFRGAPNRLPTQSTPPGQSPAGSGFSARARTRQRSGRFVAKRPRSRVKTVVHRSAWAAVCSMTTRSRWATETRRHVEYPTRSVRDTRSSMSLLGHRS